MTARTVLLLDVMDTIVWDPFRRIPGFFGMSGQEMWTAMHPTSWHEFERGEIDEATFLRRFFADERPYDHERFRELMFDGYRWIDGMEALLGDLHRAGVEMHALSNYPSWWEEIEERFRLSRFLQWTFVSCRTGVRKPAEGAYLGAAEALGQPPEALLFIDDRERNTSAAEAAGLGALLFVDAAGLRAGLTDRGLLPATAG